MIDEISHCLIIEFTSDYSYPNHPSQTFNPIINIYETP